MGSGDSVQCASAERVFRRLGVGCWSEKCPFGSVENGNLGVNVDRWVLYGGHHRRGF
jgi:hypothetical protein